MGEMSTQMRQFYMNGGGTAWVTRLAICQPRDE